MMREWGDETMSLQKRVSIILIALMHPIAAHAGSVAGSESRSQTDGDTDCDIRRGSFSCTSATKNWILDKCYVVVHKDKLEHCTWQSCEYLSIVGKNPSYEPSGGGGAGRMTEYGISHNVDTESQSAWECNTSNGCLPKSPFPRHYMTVKQALEIRNSSDSSEVAQKIKAVPAEVLSANRYVNCAMSEDATVLVRVKTRGSDKFEGPGILVAPSAVEAACDAAQKFRDRTDKGDCYSGGDANGVGAVKVKSWSQVENNPFAGAKLPSAPAKIVPPTVPSKGQQPSAPSKSSKPGAL